MNNMNIVLTGLRGSGKTKIAKTIAQKTGLEFIDIDDEIIKKENLTIPEIVEKFGWNYFRQKEKEAVKTVSKKRNLVIATGGGVILDPENIENLKKTGIIVFLNVEPKLCAHRIKNSKKRPPLTGSSDIYKEMFQIHKERQPLYEKTADIIFNRTKSIAKDAEKIIEIWGKSSD